MILKHVIITEKSSAAMEQRNELQFIVDNRATKSQIRDEIENLFDVRVVSVRTTITPKGEKKAFVTLSDADSAEDVITKMGVL
ncbi:MAG TPA: 50S ribosomal protein L23 [Candidatus Syntrophoarchaeum butanivorans]|uniref:Large ribosomal subunit protein uL23 n=1 Tax=Candidatus Syntropharchaeum butanivorans TaxID=1839936 RepID=A0A1F2P448_9EURY|nr:MAG: Ribosomal protein L23 [Candidatus Syntrophoarchaeum butanivorans]RJS71406.1 MAG: 50S ribosomal protein L23 [Candidatus Syntrophoarchaeum sp. WYZ-LMO15]HDM35923.1 50S ribosomal protein L23 [Candidatus Syntrophoarchaeum butanivorans]HEC57770.1 50S ribosomal protein L23 [Candidatus Syntrophoarchaeum butanivorans]